MWGNDVFNDDVFQEDLVFPVEDSVVETPNVKPVENSVVATPNVKPVEDSVVVTPTGESITAEMFFNQTYGKDRAKLFIDAWHGLFPKFNSSSVPSVSDTPDVKPIDQDYNNKDLSSGNVSTDDTLEKATEIIEDKATFDLEKAQAREDMIRKETQAREDSAFQRAIADMRKAGINPNLFGVTPSASGSGIVQASRKENVLSAELSSYSSMVNQLAKNATDELLTMLNIDFSADQASKDRVQKYFSSIFGGLVGLFG